MCRLGCRLRQGGSTAQITVTVNDGVLAHRLFTKTSPDLGSVVLTLSIRTFSDVEVNE
jgi:hypothetical protein